MRLDRDGRAIVVAFVTAFVTLLTQVLVHRVIAAKLLTNYAFLVVSLTMLGFAASGVILSRWIDRFLEDDRFFALAASLFVLTLLGATWAFYRVPSFSQIMNSRPDFVAGFLRSVPLALLYAVPFTFCGLILGRLLSDARLAVQRVYFADLVGSAMGAAAAIPCISLLGAERGIAASCALLLLSTAVHWPPRGLARWTVVLGGAAVAFVAWRPGLAFQMWYPESAGRGQAIEYVAWDAVARVEVSRMSPPDPPADPSVRCLVGENPAFTRRFEKVITQNNWNGTMALAWDGRRESLTGIDTTLYAAAYEASLVEAPRVAVIGVGAGNDVLSALYYGASHITGIEVNAATVDIVKRARRDYFRAWVQDPRLELFVDDGRSHLTGRRDAYDVIQISGVDSFVGTAASPHIFSENYLYTGEAFELYLSRLTERGVLNVMRFEHAVPQAMLRILVTATGALRRAGVAHPARHIVTVTTDDGRYTAVLVKRTPFSAAELAKVRSWTGKSRTFGLSAAPGFLPPGRNVLHEFLALDDAQAERRFVARYPFDVAPTTDDRPFFFRYSFWWHVFPADALVWAFVPIMEYSLILLLALVGLATVAFVYIPLRWVGPGVERLSFGAGSFFAALGIGFMAVEIAFLQKFGWFLGHPNYGLSVVLATLLFTSGLGSMVSPRLVSAVGRLRYLAYVLSAVIFALYFVGFPLLQRYVGSAFPVKVLIVMALVAPAGLVMGCFFPWGLAALGRTGTSPISWAWGVNGIFSVLGPLVSIGVCMTWGANALLLTAIPVYLLAGLASASLESLDPDRARSPGLEAAEPSAGA